MTTQLYTLEGELLPEPIRVKIEELRAVGLDNYSLPNGLIGINTENGLANVILSNARPPVWMKLGRLLKRNHLDDTIVRTVAEKLKALKLALKLELKFTETSDDVEFVYDNGPHSCMKGDPSVRAYATDDVAVAYIEDETGVLARSVVCKNVELGLQYTRIYGFAEPLKILLTKANYKEGSLEGCSIRKLEGDHGTRLPYIDSVDYVDVREEDILITRWGEFGAQNTTGYIDGRECECCGEILRSENEEYYSDYTEQTMCESCFDEKHIYVDGYHYHVDDEKGVVELYNGEYAKKDDCVYIEYRDDYYREGDAYYNSYTEEYILKEDIE